MINIAFKNLGCKVNSYELQQIRELFKTKDFNEISFDSIADIYIINTCTVTSVADKKSRQFLHDAKNKNKNSIVVAVGCFVDNSKNIDKKVDICICNKDKHKIKKIIDNYIINNINNLDTNFKLYIENILNNVNNKNTNDIFKN